MLNSPSPSRWGIGNLIHPCSERKVGRPESRSLRHNKEEIKVIIPVTIFYQNLKTRDFKGKKEIIGKRNIYKKEF